MTTGCPTRGSLGFFTTWIRHCSTCLLISSSLPVKGALHSGHTWPPSSGFLLFIFPIRAEKEIKKNLKRNTETLTHYSNNAEKKGNPHNLTNLVYRPVTCHISVKSCCKMFETKPNNANNNRRKLPPPPRTLLAPLYSAVLSVTPSPNKTTFN